VEIEKSLLIAAPADRVWSTLLDAKVMAGCMPGVQSVEVLSDNEYVAGMKVKISFISAHFKIKTTIVEAKAPHYLRCEGSGEDSAVASTVKQTSEMFLTSQPDGSTELRVKASVDVFGRLGSFGLGVMKTRADRMWDEFADNLAAVFRQPAAAGVTVASASAATSHPVLPVKEAPAVAVPPAHQSVSTPPAHATPDNWWSRWFGRGGAQSNDIRTSRLPSDIYIEVQRAGDTIKVLWPASDSSQASAWLKSIPVEKSQ